MRGSAVPDFASLNPGYGLTSGQINSDAGYAG
jgi:hypothetical protein